MTSAGVVSGDADVRSRDPLNLCQHGDVLGGVYRVERLIGKGGMGEVYEVEHLRLGARFAAKVLRAGHDPWPDAVRRFRREAAALAALRSDHVVRVFDVCEPDVSVPFYAMELLDGQDLRRLLAQERALDVERAVRITMGACLGVAAMHDAGLVHRDLKPANLFVTHRDDGEEVCKLLDFGVTKRENASVTTAPGAFVGTLRYVPPEQIENAATVGKRADVYSLAVILYEALTGRPAHAAESVERLIYSILNTTPAPIRELDPSFPAELDELLQRAMARDPEARLARVLDLYEALAAFSEQSAPNDSATLREGKLPISARPKPSRATAARAVVVALGVGVVLTALVLRSPSAAESETAPVAPPSTADSSPPVVTAPSTPSVAPGVSPLPSALSVAGSTAAPPSRPVRTTRIAPAPSYEPPTRSGLRLEVKNPYAH